MAAVNPPDNQLLPRAGVKRQQKHNLRIDMTPMVDLGFLLISFFVITTELTRPTAMNLYMPADGPPSELGMSDALTIIPAGNNTVWYYAGKWEDAKAHGEVFVTSAGGVNGIRKVITDKQKQRDADPKSKEKRAGLMLLIKPTPDAAYKNLVDLLDEAVICQVKKYAVVKLSDEERRWVEEQTQK